MSVDNLREVVVSGYAKTVIRVKARQLCRRSGFSRSDEDDLKQELSLLLFAKLQQFDPSRGSLNTFIARVVDSGVAMLLRERRRNKRAPATGNSIQSLEVLVDQSDGATSPLGATISQADAERRNGREPISEADLFALVEDVRRLMDALPPQAQAVCRSLMERNRTETENELALSRRAMSAAMTQIRQHFARGGFGEN